MCLFWLLSQQNGLVGKRKVSVECGGRGGGCSEKERRIDCMVLR